VGDGGCFAPVRCIELLQDVRDMDAGGFDADDEFGGDLPVGVAADEEGEDLGLARRQAECFREAWFWAGGRGLRRREIEPCPLGEQLDLA
jgi:hypothetical protein